MFSEYFFPLSLCQESTSYVLSFRMVFFLPCDHGLDFLHQLSMLLLLFLTFSALVANPKKTTLHGGQSRSWCAEQGKKEREKVWQRPPPPRARCSFGEKNNALAPGYLKGTVVRGHPVVWSLALRSDNNAKQDPVVYGTKFGVVFLAEGPRTASIQEGFDCFGLYHPDLERERDFRLAVELM